MVHASVLDPALDTSAMNLHHLGPVMMHSGMHNPNSAFGPSIGVPTHSYAAALSAHMAVPGITVPGDGTTGVLDPTMQNGALPQDPAGAPADFSVGGDPNRVALSNDGMLGVVPQSLTMGGGPLQSVLHGAVPTSHEHGLISVGGSHGHGMISVGDGPGVIPVTDADGLMGISVGHGSTDEMLHMTDAHGLMQQFEQMDANPGYPDPLESPKDGEPDSKKPRLFDDIKLDSTDENPGDTGL